MTHSEAVEAIVTMRGAESGADLDLSDTPGRPDYHPLAPPVLPDDLRAELDGWFERCRAAMPRVQLAARPGSEDEYQALMGAGQLALGAQALDTLSLRLSTAEWSDASGMEDVNEIVRGTGRREIANAPEWRSH